LSDDLHLEVRLEETGRGDLVLNVAARSKPADETIVAVTYTLEDDAGVHDDELVTPLAPATAAEDQTATYGLGSARRLRGFGIVGVQLLAADAVDLAAAERSLASAPYGNAMRAWDEVTRRVDRPPLRALYESFATE
jgi:hypothetical protein